MAHQDRKVRRKRGSRTHGYGARKKHRGSGTKGGKGMAGSKKHKWSYISKNLPDYFKRKGFKRPSKTVRKRKKIINVGELEKLLEKEKIKKDKKTELNLRSLGYDKLLGKGNVAYPFVIIIDEYSPKALKKIEKVGGKIGS